MKQNFERVVYYCTIIFMLFITWQPGYSKEYEKKRGNKVEMTLEGMAGVSFGDKIVAFNVGGPDLVLNIGKNWRTGLGAFPSFFVRNGKTGARLGVGGRVDYRNMVLFSSFFHFDRTDTWVGTLGLGYKFHKNKK